MYDLWWVITFLSSSAAAFQHLTRETGHGGYLGPEDHRVSLEERNSAFEIGVVLPKQSKYVIAPYHPQDVRLNKELAGYQKRLGLEQIPLTEKLDGNQQMDLIYLAPLFMAYDDRIQKMDQMIDTLIDDLKELENKTQHLVEDNSYLRKQLEIKDEQLIKAHKSGGVPQENSIQNVFSKLEKDELSEKIRLFQDECQFYITKIKEFENKTWDQQNRIQAMEKNEREYITQIHELQDETKRLELEVDDLKVKRDILEQKLRNQLNMNA